jgi:NAD(P)-dependent dehydrogenase (short-subunit alcohol dehydrogenase family)
MAFEFEGSVAVVTGAASGIGRASALAFAREGADVVVSDINDEDGKQVAKEIEALGRKALYVHTDVAKRQEVEDLVDASIAWQGHCDLFHSNAGIGMGGAPQAIPVDEWERVLDINLHSHIWTVRKLLPHMLERGSGHLVHTASSAGTIGFAMLIPYCVTKFGVVGLCESLASYVYERGVGVSVVCPLLVSTNIFERSWNYPEEDAAPIDEQFQEQVRQIFKEAGMPPEQVADEIVRGVKENHLYVFPHPELKAMIDAKWADPDAFVRNASAQWHMQQEAAKAGQVPN